MDEKLIFEKSKPGKEGCSLPREGMVSSGLESGIPPSLKRTAPPVLPEVSEPEIVRHFTNLSRCNMGVDTNFYPLGSCTMKYNPRVNETIAQLSGFRDIHPLQPADTTQGMLKLLYELERHLSLICGMERFTLQPAAGAHGELCGMMLVRAYHKKHGNGKRKKVIVPDSSHGTNPASAALFGFEVVVVPSNERGRVDRGTLDRVLNDETACLMMTNPNTLGLFEDEIVPIAKLTHERGGLLYYDGANLNACLGKVRPGDMGFDIVHLNLHKTFSTPHGGGGPGSGPVGVSKEIVRFLPSPLIAFNKGCYTLEDSSPDSIGRLKLFHGNIGVLVRAYAYIRSMGSAGLAQASEDAVLSANYLRNKISKAYDVPYNDFCMHEFVASAARQNLKGVHAGDIAKRLIDYGFHPPTVYFPLIVKEALMIEPTETEPKETLERFIEAMLAIAKEAEENPDIVKKAPHTTVVGRCDEVLAAREPTLCYQAPK
ncbi:MAG: aminomethyl-transferring glycine dehydrogenase subunit GcvPB [Candidatus Omnitrophica bacterium]|nr:aminomethyl-transferring glycine dehydrogenase subunit GcvPB [Candidatus Omnitrophota bacterium]